MWATLGGFVFGGFKTWMENRREKAQAVHTKEMKVITGDLELETETVKAAKESWKDEYLTLLLSVPIILVFYACVADDPNMLDRTLAAFEAMKQLPEWYHYYFGVTVLGSFGLRGWKAVKGMKQ